MSDRRERQDGPDRMAGPTDSESYSGPPSGPTQLLSPRLGPAKRLTFALWSSLAGRHDTPSRLGARGTGADTSGPGRPLPAPRSPPTKTLKLGHGAFKPPAHAQRGRRAGWKARHAHAVRARGRDVGFPEAAGRGRRAHPDGWRRLRGGRRRTAAAAAAGAGGEGSGAGTGTAAARTRPASPAPARRPRARRPGATGRRRRGRDRLTCVGSWTRSTSELRAWILNCGKH